ncbi:hypothetical protein AOXY_G28579 [Acipenser oxyrinchus oxyrinchus]|uniref:Uncharacterized protein n=1 Tax=Acipenser oxyrinchus oxyrinchus TaxID=40147 RepID=A0AAD8CMX7_ACIOX|nr:hypothetical protein AOXY_G28567 [Acipenser oxyrinchus oxyrinchus]KAK1154593.1 hypothetical protein AOXY_G28579 [Acipenser oxyrinchus oxyrinchus]
MDIWSACISQATRQQQLWGICIAECSCIDKEHQARKSESGSWSCDETIRHGQSYAGCGAASITKKSL